MRVRRTAAVAAAVFLSALATAPAPAAADEAQVVCRLTDSRLTELSGITWSARHPGVYWVHNDSGGGPYLYAVDGRTCRTLARVRVAGIGARDLEAVATGVDPAGRKVLWLGDIGDNRDSWPSVRLHAVPEPAQLVDQEVRATTYRFTYPDGPHNAEAILADPSSATLWVVTKQTAAGSVWRVPLSMTSVTRARRVGPVGGLVTDAAMAPDGSRYVIRDYVLATQHAGPVSAASVAAGSRVDLPLQPQGEGVTFTADGTALLVVSERDDRLWRVPLPALPGGGAAGSVSPSSGSGSATPGSSSGSASPSGSAVGTPDDGGSGTDLARWALGGLAVVAAVGVAAVASRRLRA